MWRWVINPSIQAVVVITDNRRARLSSSSMFLWNWLLCKGENNINDEPAAVDVIRINNLPFSVCTFRSVKRFMNGSSGCTHYLLAVTGYVLNAEMELFCTSIPFIFLLLLCCFVDVYISIRRCENRIKQGFRARFIFSDSSTSPVFASFTYTDIDTWNSTSHTYRPYRASDSGHAIKR